MVCWLLVAAVLVLFPSLNSVRPTDDMFYVDAAWRLQSGTFEAPTPNSPYHHYLRWPVILPLSGLMALLGPSVILFKMYSLLYFVICSFALFLIIKKENPDSQWAWIGSLAPLIVPFEVLSPRVLSESVALAWFVTGLALAICVQGRWRNVALVLAGVCAAVAINAAQVLLFATPAIWFASWYYNQVRAERKWTDVLVAGLVPALGAIAAYLIIIVMEGMVLGDALIQIKAIGWWHMKTISPASESFASLFNLGSPNNIFGYLSNLTRAHFVFFLFLLCLGAIVLRWSPKLPSVILISGLIAFVALEVISPVVVDKDYLRFVATPLVLIVAGCVATIVPTLRTISLCADEKVLFASLLLTAGLGFSFSARSNLASLQDDNWTTYFRAPIELIGETIAGYRIADADSAIHIIDSDIPGLIPWGIAANVYSQYTHKQMISQGPISSPEFEAVSTAGAPNLFVIVSDEANKTQLLSKGFQIVEPSRPYQYPAPTVLCRCESVILTSS